MHRGLAYGISLNPLISFFRSFLYRSLRRIKFILRQNKKSVHYFQLMETFKSTKELKAFTLVGPVSENLLPIHLAALSLPN